jgi:hypothetical protein
MSVPYTAYDEFKVVEGGLLANGNIGSPFLATIRAVKVPPRGYIHAVRGAHTNVNAAAIGRKFKLWMFTSLYAANQFCTATMDATLAAALAADTTNAYYKKFRPDTGILFGPISWDSAVAEAPGVLATSGFSTDGYQNWRAYQCVDGAAPANTAKQLYAVVACAPGSGVNTGADDYLPRVQLAITIDVDT